MGTFWLALPAGVLISMVVMTVGFGGGILWMPFLLMVLKLEPSTALLTSLLIQTVGTASGSFAYVRHNTADLRLAFFLLALAVPGVALGAFVAKRLTLSHIGLIIGLISLGTALLFVASNRKYDQEGTERVALRKAYRHSWVALVMAVTSGMLTISIGEWLVPVMQKKMLLRMSNAVATCIVITCGMSLLGAAVHLSMASRPSMNALLWAAPGVLLGGQIGPLLVARIDEGVLKEVFVFLLTLIGIHLVYSSYPG